jgi:glycosidase
MEFHISRQARDRYQFDQTLFEYTGNVIIANFHAARLFAQKINQKQDLIKYPELAVKASDINAMGLIDEILHVIIQQYRSQKNPQVFGQLIEFLQAHLAPKTVTEMELQFIEDFPPLAVYRGDSDGQTYLAEETRGIPNQQVLYEELILLWVSNQNQALKPFSELIDDENLKRTTAYKDILTNAYQFFQSQPKFGPKNENLLDMLCAPARAHPNSLLDQLEYMRRYWPDLVGAKLQRLLSSLDFITEENRPAFTGPGPVEIPVFTRDSYLEDEDQENFSPDKDWMPRLVLMAKNTYVWLSQLSQTYGRPIHRLDQIPDAELDRLASYGFTGLWLIGLWERSQASARIKQLCGNPEAIASAYSLMCYAIAGDLGGEEAYQNLRDRAAQRGIRLASDMVPNHMAIDSDWVRDHPEWFIGLDYSPFPSYTFNGANLSPNSNVGIFIEDHYYDRTDAAVVFKRVDYSNGSQRYIYHGNDGTSMPWNDTAQLDYLNPQVREAVIQVILNVARRFPVIRFDAAMTLAKRQFQRLWFPEPGSGGAIPSRAEFGLTRDQFNQAFPEEFWREVVDRVAAEAPDTLLLAEAFWMMEGYFVRTLGMHRVYNSAFMNMLRDEENGNYRKLMKNTLEFEPEILKRYVNFMNNPDERTAVDQFGGGDKYFGVCILMCTMPGLPMFGHGQIEGFVEKYGMEYQRAYLDEQPNQGLIERHQRHIFPLLHRRAIFADVENFLLYDFLTPGGWVNEDVFAYSNNVGKQRSLVIYHNKYAETIGQVYLSSAVKTPTGLKQKTLLEGLEIQPAEHKFITFRDQISGLEYIRSSIDLDQHGLNVSLQAYGCHVFLDFEEIWDDEAGSYRRLTEHLGGRGTVNLQETMQELWLGPAVRLIKQIYNPGYFQYLMANRLTVVDQPIPAELLVEARQKLATVLAAIAPQQWNGMVGLRITSSAERLLKFTLSIPVLFSQPVSLQWTKAQKAWEYFARGLVETPIRWIGLLSACFVLDLHQLTDSLEPPDNYAELIEEWRIPQIMVRAAQAAGHPVNDADRLSMQLKLIVNQQEWYRSMAALTPAEIAQIWFSKPQIQQFIGLNRFRDILWFNQESYLDFLWWTMTSALYKTVSLPAFTITDLIETLIGAYDVIQPFLEAEPASRDQLTALMDALNQIDKP